MAVEASHASLLLNLIETLNLRLQFINYFGGSDLINLMEIANSSLDDFYQDKSLDNSVASGTDSQIIHCGDLGEDSQSVSEILLDLTSRGNTDLILSGLNLGLRNFLVPFHVYLWIRH
jgi:hypothetical protein